MPDAAGGLHTRAERQPVLLTVPEQALFEAPSRHRAIPGRRADTDGLRNAGP